MGLHSDIYKHSVKLGMMVDTAELYSLMSVSVTFTFIQDHVCVRKQKLLHSFSCKFLSRFWWNLLCCHGLLVRFSMYYYFFFTLYIFKGENCTLIIWEKIGLRWACIQVLLNWFLSNLVWWETGPSSTCWYLDLPSMVQGYKKAGTCAVVLL